MMAIAMNGQTFTTLSDELYVGGQRILSAYVNDTLVYPNNVPSVMKFASAHTSDTLLRWDNSPSSYYNRYCTAFSGKILISSLFPSFATGTLPMIGINDAANPSQLPKHSKYNPIPYMFLPSELTPSDGVHGDDYRTCVLTHSEVAMQVTASFAYSNDRYTNSIAAMTTQLANGITIHCDYHENIVDLETSSTGRSSVIVMDPREVTLGSCTETYRQTIYESTYGIRVHAGFCQYTNTMYVDIGEAYTWFAPHFVVSAVFRRPSATTVIPVGMFFVDTFVYPSISGTSYLSRRTSYPGPVLNRSNYSSSNGNYTDKYNVYEITRWPSASDADFHATVAELAALT